jgi:hypothetical protein
VKIWLWNSFWMAGSVCKELVHDDYWHLTCGDGGLYRVHLRRSHLRPKGTRSHLNQLIYTNKCGIGLVSDHRPARWPSFRNCQCTHGCDLVRSPGRALNVSILWPCDNWFLPLRWFSFLDRWVDSITSTMNNSVLGCIITMPVPPCPLDRLILPID